jgi:hypothetical protein
MMWCPHVNLVKSHDAGYECSRCGAEFSVEPRDVVARGMSVLTTERGAFVLATISAVSGEQ